MDLLLICMRGAKLLSFGGRDKGGGWVERRRMALSCTESPIHLRGFQERWTSIRLRSWEGLLGSLELRSFTEAHGHDNAPI